jgi:hypothetical protein
MSAHPPTSQGTDPITLPGATVLPLGADPPAEEARLHDDESLADTLEQALTKRDKTHFMLGFERGFVAGMGSSMVVWGIVSLVSSLFGEYEAMVKGVMMGFYIFLFARG